MAQVKRNYVQFSYLFSELQQYCVYIITGMEGVLWTLELCLDRGHPVCNFCVCACVAHRE